ncbi:MAG: NosD domain-containing protein [Candidatus Freyarchaeum deiterrae]
MMKVPARKGAVKVILLAVVLLTATITFLSIQNQNTCPLVNAYLQDIFPGSPTIIQEKTINISSDYTFNGDFYETINVAADNIVIDGNGYTVQGNGSGYGFYLGGRSNVTIKNAIVKGWQCGFCLEYSSYNTLSDNTAINNTNYGFNLYHSSYNTLSGNTANNNGWGGGWGGFHLDSYSSYNNLSGNTATNNPQGFELYYYSDHNNLLSNTASYNGWGFYLDSSSYNTLRGNTIIIIYSGNDIRQNLGSHDNILMGNTVISTSLPFSLYSLFYSYQAAQSTSNMNSEFLLAIVLVVCLAFVYKMMKSAAKARSKPGAKPKR